MELLARPRVLLVEDDPDDEFLALNALRSGGWQGLVEVARDGEEALQYLLSATEPPSLVMMDLKLPKISGDQVLRRLRENRATRLLPVVILSSSGEESDISRCYREGANSYVRKPLEPSQFRTAVQNIRNYWLNCNRVPV